MYCIKNTVYPVFCIILLLGLCATPYTQAQDDNTYNEPYRPQYHFSPPEGRMGDPSGLVHENGAFHLFYWGHARSSDLLHWKHLPQALTDAMSGSVVIDRDNSSGFGTDENPPWVAIFSEMDDETRIQTQSLAYSTDGGITWTKYEGNPVIDIGSTEFRDPQVFWYEPKQRWIMVVALAEDHQVRFYSSDDLVDWTHLSDFGPAGATRGVWEVPDFFPLPVDGKSDNTKWVLKIDVQPIGPQYFVGDFNGTSFRLDPSFEQNLVPTGDPPPNGRVIEDFEDESYENWRIEGEAFGDGPVKGAIFPQTPVVNFEGSRFVNGYHGGDEPTGSLTSPSFTIDRPYLSFKIGGGDHPDTTAVRLLINEEVVRSATGRNMETLHWRSWDIKDLQGKTGHVQVIDRSSDSWGHVNVDHIMLSDEPARTKRERAFWVDHGMDFYAARAWRDLPSSDNRRIWIAWMGDWRYEHLVPTKGWRGVQSIPRTLSLVSTPEGPRLVQRPIRELQQLRGEPFILSDTEVENTLDLTTEHGVTARSAELIIAFEPRGADTYGVRVRTGDKEETEIGISADSDSLYVDRSESGIVGFSRTFSEVSTAPLPPTPDGSVHLRVFVDRSTLEVFGNEGRAVLSNLIFPSPESSGIEVFAEGGPVQVRGLKVYPLQSVR